MANLFNAKGKSRLDSPERIEWMKPDLIVSELGLEPGAVVADIGAGTGFFTFRIARRVSPSGKVYAIDIQQEMLDTIGERAAEQGVSNVIPVLSEPVKNTLPDAEVDLVFMSNVTHEYDDLDAGLCECARILKPGGKLAVVDWKPEETAKGPMPGHRISADRVIQAAAAAGFSEAGRPDLVPYHYVLFFKKLG